MLAGATPNRYKLPAFLAGTVSGPVYERWLTIKARTLIDRDRKRGESYSAQSSVSVYKQKIHAAVLSAGLFDPYTGERLRWDLIGTWDTSHSQEPGYKKQFALMPTVDHTSPSANELELEICSFRINDAKSDLEPDEFRALCRLVAQYKKG